jgi:dTDP-4-dehydrorhamnose 3,5-epimerase-like enzyme
MKEKPTILKFQSIGSSSIGYITVAEDSKQLPFEIKRVYWTYYTPQNITRGYHAHKALRQIIFAVAGEIHIKTENVLGTKETFILNEPSTGLYIPPLIWREIKFSHSAVLLCLASEEYDERDYIRDYDNFKQLSVT